MDDPLCILTYNINDSFRQTECSEIEQDLQNQGSQWQHNHLYEKNCIFNFRGCVVAGSRGSTKPIDF